MRIESARHIEAHYTAHRSGSVNLACLLNPRGVEVRSVMSEPQRIVLILSRPHPPGRPKTQNVYDQFHTHAPVNSARLRFSYSFSVRASFKDKRSALFFSCSAPICCANLRPARASESRCN